MKRHALTLAILVIGIACIASAIIFKADIVERTGVVSTNEIPAASAADPLADKDVPDKESIRES